MSMNVYLRQASQLELARIARDGIDPVDLGQPARRPGGTGQQSAERMARKLQEEIPEGSFPTTSPRCARYVVVRNRVGACASPPLPRPAQVVAYNPFHVYGPSLGGTDARRDSARRRTPDRR